MPVEHVILGDAIWFWHHPAYTGVLLGLVALACAALWLWDRVDPLP